MTKSVPRRFMSMGLNMNGNIPVAIHPNNLDKTAGTDDAKYL